ncbi:hypothetical protein QN277_018649 [Acacia crassicarpa]|uniref:Uncharacterized protein n=1 Tax=Acacia crassicarpa TaxID=499986 RepID=A0AAE1KHZ7_9FABA|nr:hypothetical protein QN277_018649 [Acacia crassicarpa]
MGVKSKVQYRPKEPKAVDPAGAQDGEVCANGLSNPLEQLRQNECGDGLSKPLAQLGPVGHELQRDEQMLGESHLNGIGVTSDAAGPSLLPNPTNNSHPGQCMAPSQANEGKSNANNGNHLGPKKSIGKNKFKGDRIHSIVQGNINRENIVCADYLTKEGHSAPVDANVNLIPAIPEGCHEMVSKDQLAC